MSEESAGLKKEAEALLFAAGRKISVEEIAKLCKAEKKDVENALAELKKEYAEKDSPLFLIEEGDGWKMTVKDRYISLVKEVSPHTELNRAMLETLAVIAWKQPVLQSEVIKMRTSSAYEDIKLLLEMGFISKAKQGRSFVLKPTGRFFDYFDLPSKEKLREMFKDIEGAEQQAESQKEVGDIKTHPDKIGQLDVYGAAGEAGVSEEEKGSTGSAEQGGLGRLAVFEMPPSEIKDLQEQEKSETEKEREEVVEEAESAEEETKKKKKRDSKEDGGEDESAEDDEDNSEEADEPKEGTGDEEEPEEKQEYQQENNDAGNEEEAEDTPGSEEEGKKGGSEEESGEEEHEEMEPEEAGGRKEKKSRLPKELEEFAGTSKNLGEE